MPHSALVEVGVPQAFPLADASFLAGFNLAPAVGFATNPSNADHVSPGIDHSLWSLQTLCQPRMPELRVPPGLMPLGCNFQVYHVERADTLHASMAHLDMNSLAFVGRVIRMQQCWALMSSLTVIHQRSAGKPASRRVW